MGGSRTRLQLNYHWSGKLRFIRSRVYLSRGFQTWINHVWYCRAMSEKERVAEQMRLNMEHTSKRKEDKTMFGTRALHSWFSRLQKLSMQKRFQLWRLTSAKQAVKISLEQESIQLRNQIRLLQQENMKCQGVTAKLMTEMAQLEIKMSSIRSNHDTNVRKWGKSLESEVLTLQNQLTVMRHTNFLAGCRYAVLLISNMMDARQKRASLRLLLRWHRVTYYSVVEECEDIVSHWKTRWRRHQSRVIVVVDNIRKCLDMYEE